MFPLILAVLNRDYNRGRGGTRIPIKDGSSKGENPKIEVGFVLKAGICGPTGDPLGPAALGWQPDSTNIKVLKSGLLSEFRPKP